MKIKATFTEPVLGTWPNNKRIAEDYIASKNPNVNDDPYAISDEVDAIDEADIGMTVFPRNMDDLPCFYDYQIKGFLKDSWKFLKGIGGEYGKECAKIKNYRQKIDGLIFVEPRMIPVIFDGEIGTCQRPLRAMTMRGERISLAMSEELPAGATIEFEIICLDPEVEGAVIECLNYGKLRGLGQWRNSGKGRFTYEKLS